MESTPKSHFPRPIRGGRGGTQVARYEKECIYLKAPKSPERPMRKNPLLVSSLHMLPQEIRQQIWDYVLGGRTFHIFAVQNRLMGRECLLPDLEACRTANRSKRRLKCMPCKVELKKVTRWTRKKVFLSLLSHVISNTDLFSFAAISYSEALPALYTHTRFDTTISWVITNLPTWLPTTHLNHIRHLDFAWCLYGIYRSGHTDTVPVEQAFKRARHSWRRTLAGLLQMQGLSTLFLKLSTGGYYTKDEVDAPFDLLRELVLAKPGVVTLELFEWAAAVGDLRKRLQVAFGLCCVDPIWAAGSWRTAAPWEKLHCIA